MNRSEEVVCTLCGHKATASTVVEAVEKLWYHERDQHGSVKEQRASSINQPQMVILISK